MVRSEGFFYSFYILLFLALQDHPACGVPLHLHRGWYLASPIPTHFRVYTPPGNSPNQESPEVVSYGPVCLDLPRELVPAAYYPYEIFHVANMLHPGEVPPVEGPKPAPPPPPPPAIVQQEKVLEEPKIVNDTEVADDEPATPPPLPDIYYTYKPRERPYPVDENTSVGIAISMIQNWSGIGYQENANPGAQPEPESQLKPELQPVPVTVAPTTAVPSESVTAASTTTAATVYEPVTTPPPVPVSTHVFVTVPPAIPAPTSPPVPPAVFVPTTTPVPGTASTPAHVPVPPPTLIAITASSSVPVPESTPIPVTASTPVPVPPSTPIPTSTPVPVPTFSPVPVTPSTPVPVLAPTLIPVITSTPVPVTPSSPTPVTTPTPVGESTPVPAPTLIPVTISTPTPVPSPAPQLPCNGSKPATHQHTAASITASQISAKQQAFLQSHLAAPHDHEDATNASCDGQLEKSAASLAKLLQEHFMQKHTLGSNLPPSESARVLFGDNIVQSLINFLTTTITGNLGSEAQGMTPQSNSTTAPSNVTSNNTTPAVPLTTTPATTTTTTTTAVSNNTAPVINNSTVVPQPSGVPATVTPQTGVAQHI